MKKHLFLASLVCASSLAMAQNTFPSSGNVGVGSASPINKLQIGTNPNGFSGNDLVVSNANGSFAIHNNSNDTYLYSNRDISIRPGSQVALYAKSNGSIGIGSSNPDASYKLDVYGNVGLRNVTYFYGTAYAYEQSTGQYLHFKTNSGKGYVGMNSGNDLVLQLNGGNVGIGSNNPMNKLEIGTNPQGFTGNDLVVSNSNGSFAINNNQSDTYLYSNRDISIRAGGQIGIYAKSNGSIAIGSSNPDPSYKLDVYGNVGLREVTYFYGTAYAFEPSTQQYLHFKTTGGKGYVGMNSSNDIILQANGGNVGIGTAPDAALTVKGDIHTREVTVDLNGAVAPDYVFERDYDLKSLEETEAYIKSNKHLPDVPSAAEMEENGIQLKAMNLMLLQKVEELTLHLIEQNKIIKSQNDRISALENKFGEDK